MKRKNLAILFVPAIFTLFFWECGNEQVVDIAAVTSTPRNLSVPTPARCVTWSTMIHGK